MGVVLHALVKLIAVAVDSVDQTKGELVIDFILKFIHVDYFNID